MLVNSYYSDNKTKNKLENIEILGGFWSELVLLDGKKVAL